MAKSFLFERLDERFHSMFIGLLNNELAAMIDVARAASATVMALRPKDGSRALLGKEHFVHNNQREVAKNKVAFQRRKAGLLKMDTKKPSAEAFFRLIQEWQGKSFRYLHANVSPRLWKCAVCRRYFLADDDRRVRCYCSETCRAQGRKASATSAVKRTRAANKAKSLWRARLAIQAWKGTGNWKPWVAKRAGVRKNWITYRVNDGDLKAPN
jgi:hypothetical protein